MRMLCVSVAILAMVQACSSDSSSGGSSGAGSSGAAGTAGSGDAGGAGGAAGANDSGVCTQPGSSACDTVVGAWCSRSIQCCQNLPAGHDPCYDWAQDMTLCKAHWLSGKGVNCAAAPYSNKTVCESVTTQCSQDMTLVACTDMYQGTDNPPPSCAKFWAQF